MQCQAEFGEYSQLPISGRFLNKEKLLPDRQVLKRSFFVNFQYSAVSLVVLLGVSTMGMEAKKPDHEVGIEFTTLVY